MKFHCLLIIVFAIFSCKQKEIKITQIEDIYTEKNGGIPNENIFLIDHFKNDKKNIVTIFNYVKDSVTTMMPFKRLNGITEFLFNKNDVFFNDGGYEITGDEYISIYINDKNTDYYKSISIYGSKNLTYHLKEPSCIFIEYKKFNLTVLKTFLNVIQKERKKLSIIILPNNLN